MPETEVQRALILLHFRSIWNVSNLGKNMKYNPVMCKKKYLEQPWKKKHLSQTHIFAIVFFRACSSISRLSQIKSSFFAF